MRTLKKRILTKKQMAAMVKRLPNSLGNDWGGSRYGRAVAFLVREDSKIRASIHFTADGFIHAFLQNRRRPEVMFWTRRYSYTTAIELEKKFRELLRKIKQATRTRI